MRPENSCLIQFLSITWKKKPKGTLSGTVVIKADLASALMVFMVQGAVISMPGSVRVLSFKH